MDALKQQVQPATASAGAAIATGWRNLALLLGFVLAVLLGVGLASWWQSKQVAQTENTLSVSPPAEPELAESTRIAAVLLSAQSNTQAEPVSQQADPQPVQEQLKVEPEMVSVTVPAVAKQTGQPVVQTEQPAQPEVEVSDELRQRFASAMAASDIDNRPSRSVVRTNSAPAQDISELASALQQRIPPLRFEAHVYATQSSQRWVKVNGKSLQEGQWVTADIQLSEITPHYVLLKMGNEFFSMPALTDYK